MRVVEPLLGTRAEVSVEASLPAVAEAAELAVLEEVARLEAVFSVFDESSELSALRRTGTTTCAELLTVIELADTWRATTGGAFDTDLGHLTALWNLAESRNTAPTASELTAALQERDQQRASRANLDLNAIAKGWIVRSALAAIFDASTDLDVAWLSVGGDVVHLGAGTVRVGIENPLRPYDNIAPLASIDIANEALATSGGSRRFWTIGGERFSKVLDPCTGWPSDQVASATVVADDAAAADVLATVGILLAPEETLELVSSVGAECFLVNHDGSTTSSSERFRPV